MNKIKVLWFTNSPSLSVNKTNSKIVGGGWIMSLESAVKKYVNNIDLSVVFIGDNSEFFEFNGTKYYSVKPYKANVFERKFFLSRKERKNDTYLIPKYLQIIKEVEPDIIHIHGSENNYGLISTYVDIPVVMSIQGLLTVYKYKYFGGINDAKIKKNRIPGIVFNQHLSYSVRSMREEIMMKHINYFFGRTFWDRSITHLFNPDSKYYLINRVIREKFYDLQWKSVHGKHGAAILVTTMRDNVYKGFETILYAAKLLKDQGVDFEWRIAGVGKDNYLVKMFRKDYVLVENNVKLLGAVEGEDLSQLLCNADIYVQASHIENSPNGLAEAMLIGMPCIASFVGGTGSYIAQYEDGILIQDGDAWVMAGVIKELIDNKDLALKLAENAKITALRRHNPKEIATRVFAAYLDIISDYSVKNRRVPNYEVSSLS